MKKTLAITLAFVMLAISAVNAASPFTDVRETDWFCYYAQQAKDKGILAGYPDGTFRPEKQVSYGEFLAMVLKGKGNSSAGKHWAYGFYSKAEESGLFGDSYITAAQLDDPIPRRDMAVIMAQVLKEKGLGGVNAAGADTRYSDIFAWDSWEYPAALCSHYGVLNGYPDGTFRPEGGLKRSEAAAAMLALDAVIEASGKPAIPAEEEPLKQETLGKEDENTENPVPTKPETREELLKAEESLVDRSAEYKQIEAFMNPDYLKYINDLLDSALVELDASGCSADLNWTGLQLNWGDDSRFDSVKLELRVYDKDVYDVASAAMASYMNKNLRSAGKGRLELDSADLNGIKKDKVMLLVSVRTGGETASGYTVYDAASGKAERGYVLKGKISGSMSDAGYDLQAEGIPASGSGFTVR